MKLTRPLPSDQYRVEYKEPSNDTSHHILKILVNGLMELNDKPKWIDDCRTILLPANNGIGYTIDVSKVIKGNRVQLMINYKRERFICWMYVYGVDGIQYNNVEDVVPSCIGRGISMWIAEDGG